jgi:formylglycine-generating enzyme required for sulfatase activity
MEEKQSFCTMLLSTNYCRIPGYYGYKYPKLQELYRKLFGVTFDGVHNSFTDVNATVKCFWEMNRIGLIPLEENLVNSENKIPIIDINFDSEQLNSQKPQEEIEIPQEEEVEVKEEEPIVEEKVEIVEEIEEEQEIIEEVPQEEQITEENRKFSIKGVDFNMVFVKGASFKMGDGTEKTIGDYYICDTAVTQALWIAVMENNPSWYENDNFPVENISWNDASEFVRRLSEITGKNFRIPTEAEWEFAARGGIYSKGYQYSGSNDLDCVAWYKDNSLRSTHAVKTKFPNELGLYDMSGNVFEWCDDWIDGQYKILRGGCWGSAAKACLITYRFDSSPKTKGGDGGVRIAMDI